MDLVNNGMEVSYGTFFGGATRTETFQFIRVKDTFTPQPDEVDFILELESNGIFIGSDEFTIKIGADIIVESFDVDPDLQPGSTPENIGVRLRNISSTDIEDVRLTLRTDSQEFCPAFSTEFGSFTVLKVAGWALHFISPSNFVNVG